MWESITDFLVNGSRNFYLFIGVTGLVIFTVQFILSMMGIHGSEGVDADFQVEAHDVSDITGLNFFSMKAIVAFVTFFGWGGFFFGHIGSGIGGLVIAFFCGVLMMVLTTLVISLLLKMQQSGNITAASMVGKRGTVYLTVPAGRASGGMVTVSLPECTRQISARSDKELKTGSMVVVAEDLGDGNFLVCEV